MQKFTRCAEHLRFLPCLVCNQIKRELLDSDAGVSPISSPKSKLTRTNSDYWTSPSVRPSDMRSINSNNVQTRDVSTTKVILNAQGLRAILHSNVAERASEHTGSQPIRMGTPVPPIAPKRSHDSMDRGIMERCPKAKEAETTLSHSEMQLKRTRAIEALSSLPDSSTPLPLTCDSPTDADLSIQHRDLNSMDYSFSSDPPALEKVMPRAPSPKMHIISSPTNKEDKTGGMAMPVSQRSFSMSSVANSTTAHSFDYVIDIPSNYRLKTVRLSAKRPQYSSRLIFSQTSGLENTQRLILHLSTEEPEPSLLVSIEDDS